MTEVRMPVDVRRGAAVVSMGFHIAKGEANGRAVDVSTAGPTVKVSFGRDGSVLFRVADLIAAAADALGIEGAPHGE